MNSNLALSEQWSQAAEIWADQESAASLLEETKSAVLSQMMSRTNEKTVSKAEMTVKASDEWRQHVEKIVRARTAANKAKVKLEYLKMRFWEWQSAEANHRQGAKF